jgi:aryl-alcohol dehydrogenase-like predicted oxidoreductase
MTFAGGFAHGAGVDEARRIVDAYLADGGNVIDTAVNYRDGASEEVLGEVLAGRRDRFVLATNYEVSRDRADLNAAGSHRKNLGCPSRRACVGCVDRDHAVARVVHDVADEIGASPSQVAVAWTMARSPAVHPILGILRLDQLHDNLGAADLRLAQEVMNRLDAASALDVGFPHDSSATCRASCSATPTCIW